MDKLEIAKAKETRGQIIKNLYEFLGETVTAGTLRSLLRYKSYNSERDIKRAVDYLAGEDTEYIQIIIDENDYWASSVRLTPKGVNLAEGDREDLGVVVDG